MGYFDSWQSFSRTLSYALVNLCVYFVSEIYTILVKFRRDECNRVKNVTVNVMTSTKMTVFVHLLIVLGPLVATLCN